MIRHLLHLPSVVSLARQILGIKRPDDLMAIADATREQPADIAAALDASKRVVADLAGMGPVQADDFDLPPMRRHGDIEKALAELDAVESVDDLKWLWAWDAHPSNGGEAA